MNQTDKIRKIKFNRNPRFTPAGMIDQRLGEVEEMAYRVVEAACECNRNDGVRKFSDNLDLWSNLSAEYCQTYGLNIDRNALTDADLTYLRSCANFLLVVAQRKGWMIFAQFATNYSNGNGYDIYR